MGVCFLWDFLDVLVVVVIGDRDNIFDFIMCCKFIEVLGCCCDFSILLIIYEVMYSKDE